MTEQPARTERITILASPEMLEIIERLAAMNHTNRSQLIRRLIREEAEAEGIKIPEVVYYESK